MAVLPKKTIAFRGLRHLINTRKEETLVTRSMIPNRNKTMYPDKSALFFIIVQAFTGCLFLIH